MMVVHSKCYLVTEKGVGQLHKSDPVSQGVDQPGVVTNSTLFRSSWGVSSNVHHRGRTDLNLSLPFIPKRSNHFPPCAEESPVSSPHFIQIHKAFEAPNSAPWQLSLTPAVLAFIIVCNSYKMWVWIKAFKDSQSCAWQPGFCDS